MDLLNPHADFPLDIKLFLQRLQHWAKKRPDVLCLLLVGSYAAQLARPDSDVDLVIVTHDPQIYLTTPSWISEFGQVARYQKELYGWVTSLRVWYEEGLEVEYGITDERWIQLALDEGTQNVLRGGALVLLDRTGLMKDILENL